MGIFKPRKAPVRTVVHDIAMDGYTDREKVMFALGMGYMEVLDNLGTQSGWFTLKVQRENESRIRTACEKMGWGCRFEKVHPDHDPHGIFSLLNASPPESRPNDGIGGDR